MKSFIRYINEVSPPGFEGTVKAMKKHKARSNWGKARGDRCGV